PPQGLADRRGGGLRVVPGGQPAGVLGQPRQPLRRVRWPASQGRQVVAQPGHHAAHQGDEEQQVDGGEPGRAVDVEPAQPVQHRRQIRVAGVEVGDVAGVDPALRQHRAGDGGECEQEQQHQRGTHAGELPPAVAQPGGEPISDHRLTSPTPTLSCSQETNSSQAPVSRASPTRTSSTAPTRVTQAPCRRTTARAPATQRKPRPNARNGNPSPSVYAAARTAARPGCPPTAPSASTAPMVGPTQGIQERAKTAPNTGAEATPAAGSRRIRASRHAPGTRPSRAAANSSISTPAPISRTRCCSCSTRPTEAATTPAVTKTAPKPATNSSPPASTRPRARARVATATAPPAVPPSAAAGRGPTASRSAPVSPVT